MIESCNVLCVIDCYCLLYCLFIVERALAIKYMNVDVVVNMNEYFMNIILYCLFIVERALVIKYM